MKDIAIQWQNKDQVMLGIENLPDNSAIGC